MNNWSTFNQNDLPYITYVSSSKSETLATRSLELGPNWLNDPNIYCLSNNDGWTRNKYRTWYESNFNKRTDLQDPNANLTQTYEKLRRLREQDDALQNNRNIPLHK